MAKSNPLADLPLRPQLEKLAAYEPSDTPVVSLFLNLAANQHGRDSYDAFLRSSSAEHLKAFKDGSPERAAFQRAMERVNEYLSAEVNRASNGLALFTSSGDEDLFEAIQFELPFDDHWFFVGSVPHLYPLFRVIDQYPRYASVVLDTNSARILVFGLGAIERREQVTGVKTNRSSVGALSQARYQRRADNFHHLHVKEVVDTLEKIVREDKIQHIIVSGNDVVIPLFKQQLPKQLEEKLVDVLSLPRDSNDEEVIEATRGVLRKKDAETDSEHVQDLISAWQGNGLGVVGPAATLKALQMGQVEELLISGSEGALRAVKLPDDAAPGQVKAETSASSGADAAQLKLSDELVTRAQQTGARVRFIEDPQHLQEFGGVGAMLRFRI